MIPFVRGDCFDHAVPAVGGVADLESFDEFFGDVSLVNVGAGCRALLGVAEKFLEEHHSQAVGLGNDLSFTGTCPLSPVSCFLDLDPRALSEIAQRLGESHLVIFHLPAERIATCAAHEAVKNLLGGTDIHRRIAVFVERAQANKLTALVFEQELFADEVHDIGGLLHLDFQIITKRHGAIVPLLEASAARDIATGCAK